MYRIVCESYENYKNDFKPDNTDNYRYKVAEPLELILDLSLYEKEKAKSTIQYQKLEQLIFLLKKDIDKYPKAKSLLWSLDSRGISGKDYGVLSQEDFTELYKIINMFLNLSYWN